jgi:Flp pilus assembly protein TadB
VVSTAVALALLTGAGVGAGVLLVVAGVIGRDGDGDGMAGRRWSPALWRRLAVAVAAGLLVLAVTRWVVAAFAIAVLVFASDRLLGGGRRNRVGIERLEALAGWTESLRDMIATGVALPEALAASVTVAGPVIRPQLAVLVERLSAREPLESALRSLADDLDDAGADLTVAALLLNARAQGRALEAVLTALARSARSELAVRRAIAAERRSTRRAVQFVVATTVVTALGLAVGNPRYVAPYRSVTGQLVLAVVVGIFTVGFVWLSRLSAVPVSGRFLASGERSR